MRPGRVRPGRDGFNEAGARTPRKSVNGPRFNDLPAGRSDAPDTCFNEAGARTPRKSPPMLNPRVPCRLRGEFESSGIAPATVA